MVSKESFVKALKEVQESEIFFSKLNEVLHEYDCGDLYLVCCADTVPRILDELFTINDKENDWVRFWCWEMNFGAVNNGIIDDYNGNEVDLSTADKLYDFLVERKQQQQLNI